MMRCANCDAAIEPNDPAAITVQSRGVTIALCRKCQEKVLTMKIVFKRETSGVPFKFEQYLPVESEKL